MTDFTLYAGDDKLLTVTVTDGEGEPVDLTGAQKIRWQLGKGPGKTPIVEKALGQGIEVTDGPGGIFTVTLDSADTEALKGSYYHEAEVIDEDGNVSTVLTGTVTIEATLIKPEA